MHQRVAITREVSDAIGACELTLLERVPIDVERARSQHAGYIGALAEADYRIELLPAGSDMPDAVFVEDIAVVFDELAIVTRPGAASRRRETPAVEAALARYRELARLEAPATLDGGDVLVAGRRVFVGRTFRTNAEGVAQMRAILAPLGYTVCDIQVSGCLHLKSAATSIEADAVLINPEWVDRRAFGGLEIVVIDPREPPAANALRLHDRIIFPAAFPRTADRLAARGAALAIVDTSELAKAEGAVTCCSVIVD